MLFQPATISMPFRQWLLSDTENRTLLIPVCMAVILPFVVLKLYYPYPNFMPPDSNSYIEAAFTNQSINLWAIGYSRFLRLVSVFTNQHLVVVCLQYLLLQGAVLYLLFSIRYLLRPGKGLFRILLALCVLNPLLPQIANFISSDALFTTLSLVWFAQLLWLLRQPRRGMLIFHAFILLWAFMVRFNALYYPIISIIIILWAHVPARVKVAGIGWIVLLLGIFTSHTIYEYHRQTGTTQFAAFGGWQIAANALYGYAYAQPDDPATLPPQYRELHTLVNRHMDSLRRLSIRPDQEVAIYYQWDFKSPLRVYMDRHPAKDSSTDFFLHWASFAPLYAGYGRYLTLHHPGLYLQYYAWPNLVKYYVPPTKFMGSYNLESETVDPIVAKWFKWKDTRLPAYSKNRKIVITEAFPIAMAVINLLFVLGFLAFMGLSGFSKCNGYAKRVMVWTFIIWLGNMVFSVLAAPIELRYQLFPMIITLVFMALLIAFVVAESRAKAPAGISSTKNDGARESAILS